MRNIKTKGFIAVTVIIIMVSGILVHSYIVMQSALIYSDFITRHEWRAQANLNAEACLSTIYIMMNKDYFLNDDVSLKEFGCSAHIVRDHAHASAKVYVQTFFSGVSSANLDRNFIIP